MEIKHTERLIDNLKIVKSIKNKYNIKNKKYLEMDIHDTIQTEKTLCPNKSYYARFKEIFPPDSGMFVMSSFVLIIGIFICAILLMVLVASTILGIREVVN